MVKEYVESNNLIYMESSAKTGLNVDKIFTTIAENIPEDNEQNEQVAINEILNIDHREERARYTQYNCC